MGEMGSHEKGSHEVSSNDGKQSPKSPREKSPKSKSPNSSKKQANTAPAAAALANKKGKKTPESAEELAKRPKIQLIPRRPLSQEAKDKKQKNKILACKYSIYTKWMMMMVISAYYI